MAILFTDNTFFLESASYTKFKLAGLWFQVLMPTTGKCLLTAVLKTNTSMI